MRVKVRVRVMSEETPGPDPTGEQLSARRAECTQGGCELGLGVGSKTKVWSTLQGSSRIPAGTLWNTPQVSSCAAAGALWK